jgi:hypothetical protein
MMVRTLSVLSLEEFTDQLSGKPATGRASGVPEISPQVSIEKAEGSEEGWLFLGRHGRWGRVLETFHLKLRALADALRSVRIAVQRMQRPLLNLDAEAFKVRVGEPGAALPWLWTARVVLTDPGSAVALQVQGNNAKFYTLGRPARTPSYQPPGSAGASRGRGTVRIRKVFPDMAQGMVVEGTLTSQQRVEAAKSDLVWLRLTLADAPLDLYARLDPGSSMASGEWRFRTVEQRLPPQRIAQLPEGLNTPASFEVLPVLSTPCDLFSLGVLAVRMLLVNAEASLPVALDAMMSLALQVANQHDAQSPLGLRLRAVFESDPRWLAILGPHRLVWEGIKPEQALEIVPLELWMDVLGLIVGMFPGVGPDSACADYGDAPSGAPHRVFDRAAGDLDRLLLRTRSLIVIDWRYNREIHSVIRGYKTGVTTPAKSAAPTRAAK